MKHQTSNGHTPKPTKYFDVEVYANFFLALFRDKETGKVLRFQMSPNTQLDRAGLLHTLQSNLIVGFNSRGYDLPMIQLALEGATCWQIKCASDRLITEALRLREFYDEYALDWPKWDHIDLIDVAPLKASLKMYAGRLHCKKMQDLPIEPEAQIDAESARKLFTYCCNDLENTALLAEELDEQIKLRVKLSKEYGQDLRSRSDAQIAEHVIAAEVQKITGEKAVRPVGLESTRFQYKIPEYIRYESPELQAVLERVRNAWFVVNDKGVVTLPRELLDVKKKRRSKKDAEEFSVRIGHGVYRMGIGGLHSSEKCVRYVADDETLLIDRDVASFYPTIKLNLGLFPEHLGPAYLEVYRSLVNRRLEAKRLGKAAKKAGDKIAALAYGVIADSLKITINGAFGKLGSIWSRLFAPDLMIQVTMTGQLSLLMLIERLHLAGHEAIEVISANTDGILTKCHPWRYDDFLSVVKQWESDTSFETEESRYRAYYAKDVNNYIAIKEDGEIKGKGAYANHWEKPGPNIEKLKKNPSTTICIEAAVALLSKGKPIRETIRECKDITKFVAVRDVKGGAKKGDEYLGKAVRWYYSEGSKGTINYKRSKNKVPKSENAKPLMDLPETFPADVAYPWYIAETQAILCHIGFGQATLF